MPKVGTLSFPSIKLSRAIEIASMIGSELKGHVSVSSLATALDMAERGGGFAQIAAGLRDFGLVEGRKDLALTPTAERIIYAGSAEDAARARAEAFYSVELFRLMFDRLGAETPPETRLRAVVQDISKESLTTINQKLATIRAVWTDGIQTVGALSPGSPQVIKERPGEDEGHSLEEDPNFIVIKHNGNLVRVRRSAEDIGIVLRLLEVLAQEDELTEIESNGLKALPEPRS